MEEHIKKSPELVFQELWSYVSHGIKPAGFARTWESLDKFHLKKKQKKRSCAVTPTQVVRENQKMYV